jgi:hypothetical protein
MTQLISKSFLFKIIIFGAIVFTLHSCCKEDNCKSYPIQGLWIGTFTTVSGFDEPPGTNFYFAMSIYPDGKMSYKSGTNVTNYFVYAEGSWTLSGNAFSWTAKTINSLNSPRVDVSGTATYNGTNGTLTDGVVSTKSPVTQASWKLDKIK